MSVGEKMNKMINFFVCLIVGFIVLFFVFFSLDNISDKFIEIYRKGKNFI